MPTISKNNNLLTVLVYFKIEPENQKLQLDLIKGFVEKAVRKQPGLISACFHLSTDGTRIANYAQWKSLEDYYAAFNSPDVSSASNDVFIYAKPEARFYELVYSTQDSSVELNSKLATVINYFKVQPENQQKMIDAWIKFVESFAKYQPGLISANLHKSTDGTGVFNYAQWEKKEDVEEMLNSSEALKSMDAIHKIAEPDWHLYKIPYIATPV